MTQNRTERIGDRKILLSQITKLGGLRALKKAEFKKKFCSTLAKLTYFLLKAKSDIRKFVLHFDIREP